MARPHLTIYNETSIDGRVEGFETEAGRYYRLGSSSTRACPQIPAASASSSFLTS